MIVYIPPGEELPTLRRAEQLLLRFPEVSVVRVPSVGPTMQARRMQRRASARWKRRERRQSFKQGPALVELEVSAASHSVEIRRAA